MPTPSTAPAGASARLAALASAVGELVDPAGLEALRAADAAELLESLAGITTAIGRLQAAQVLIAEQVEATDASRTTGWASTKDLLTHLAGGHKGAGGGILRLGEQTRALPDVREAMLAGEVSTAQARTIARRVGRLPADPELRAKAAGLMVGQVRDQAFDATDLDRAFGEVVAGIDPDGRLLGHDLDLPRAERGAHRARYLSLAPDDLGGVRITGYACAEDAELISTTLFPLAAPQTTEPGACGGVHRSLHDHLADRAAGIEPKKCPDPGCAHTGRDPRDHGVRTLDALVELCRRAQAVESRTDALPRTHGTTARINVTIGLDDLRDQAGSGRLGSGQHLSAHAVRRLACDAEIIPAVLGGEGQVLDVGRTQRLVTTGLWSALVLRDRHCSFPGCSRPPQVCEAHHIRHWAEGGATSLDNLALLCRRHHTITHHSPWTLHLDPVTRAPAWTPPPRAPLPPGVTSRICPPTREPRAPGVVARAG